jgi:hypothetical protein
MKTLARRRQASGAVGIPNVGSNSRNWFGPESRIAGSVAAISKSDKRLAISTIVISDNAYSPAWWGAHWAIMPPCLPSV